MCVECSERIFVYSDPEGKVQEVVVPCLRTEKCQELTSRTR